MEKDLPKGTKFLGGVFLVVSFLFSFCVVSARSSAWSALLCPLCLPACLPALRLGGAPCPVCFGCCVWLAVCPAVCPFVRPRSVLCLGCPARRCPSPLGCPLRCLGVGFSHTLPIKKQKELLQ